ncbi:hypothetical protein E3N88_40847 [Mikania micrantha]|uniref:Integrase catalytic domain-containing protein n=1 Tax=Mikania micrantha TaxID=192012 RepID=A0A5N6LNQ3_9ASTR|nr:hypothetical protein E3N88_40847 [Mikania micrantha]
MQAPSLGGSYYYLLLIDDYTRMNWVYFLKSKSEAFEHFKAFKAMAEKECDSQIKVLRTDRGGEFCSQEFLKYCEQHGIKRELTIPYTPEHNGVVERKNRTVMGLTRSMLKQKELPNNFWAEGVATAVYLLNRSPTKSKPNKTPIEEWGGLRPTVHHLRIFGSIAYGLIPPQSRQKLDHRSEKCVFVGYSQQSSGYRLYNPISKKFSVQKHVTFDENGAWKWNSEGTKEHVMDHTPFLDPFPVDPVDNDTRNHSSTPTTPTQTTVPIQTISHNATLTPLTTLPRHSQDPYAHNPSTSSHSNPETSQTLTKRISKPPSWLQDYHTDVVEEETQLFALNVYDPITFSEAATKVEWQLAMKEEIAALRKNTTWDLTDLPEGKNAVGVKWTYKTKVGPDGEVSRYKARLVAKGYSQIEGIDYTETFAPVARFETIRVVIAIAAHRGWKLHQLDVKTAFLNGELTDEIYVQQPEGFIVKGKEGKVYKLRKALYGLKQAPRAWYSKIDGYFLKNGFVRSYSEPTLYIKESQDQGTMYVCLYVDDIVCTSSCDELIMNFKRSMTSEFEMSDMGLLKFFLGLEVTQTNDGVFVCQSQYAKNLLKKFGLNNSKTETTPMNVSEKLHQNDGSGKADDVNYRSAVGGLIYLTHTRPYLAYSVSVVSRFMQNPSKVHQGAVRCILRYVAGTYKMGLWYGKDKELRLLGYTYSDWGGCVDDRKSVSTNIFMMGNSAVSWSSRKQSSVALSSSEVEYISASAAACQGIWLRRILEDFGLFQNGPTVILCDNKSAINLSRNPIMHSRSKHIELKHRISDTGTNSA